LAALPLLLAVEALPDIFRTVGNVTCDMAVTRLAARARPSDGGQGQPDDEASAFPISP
jgi:Na+/H+-dicarboxylate symporter